MKRMTLGLSVLALSLAGAAIAAEDQMPAPHSETRAEAQDRAGRLFDRLDLNHDGKLDQADRALQASAMFDRLDTNHDGMISRDEFAAAHAHEPGGEQGGPDHDMPGGHPGHGGHMGRWGSDHQQMGGLVKLILYRADPGHTGMIARDAFVAAALSLFDQADTNHDGILTPEEHRAAAEAMRAQMMPHGGWHHGGDSGDMPPPPSRTPPVSN